jgi:hypothetical protein
MKWFWIWGFWKKVIRSYCVWWWLVMLPAWVCGSIGVVARFGSVEGESVVGGVAGVGVWVSCWWCCAASVGVWVC